MTLRIKIFFNQIFIQQCWRFSKDIILLSFIYSLWSIKFVVSEKYVYSFSHEPLLNLCFVMVAILDVQSQSASQDNHIKLNFQFVLWTSVYQITILAHTGMLNFRFFLSTIIVLRFIFKQISLSKKTTSFCNSNHARF